MKKANIKKINIFMLIFFCLFPSLIYAREDIKIDNYYYDELGYLDQRSKDEIVRVNKELEDKMGSQVLVVIANNDDGYEAMDYGVDIFNQNKIGDKTKNNGVLILLLVDNITDTKEIGIITGYGIEGRLNDGKVGRIIDDFMINDLKEGNYSRGLLQGFNAVVSEVADEYDLTLDKNYDSYQDKLYQDTNEGFSLGSLIIMIIFFIMISNFLRRAGLRSRGYSRGYRNSRWGYPGGFGPFINSFGDDDDDFFSGGFGGGFSGGGGSSGGGGASRKF